MCLDRRYLQSQMSSMNSWAYPCTYCVGSIVMLKFGAYLQIVTACLSAKGVTVNTIESYMACRGPGSLVVPWMDLRPTTPAVRSSRV